MQQTIARGAFGRPAPVDADPERRPGVPMEKPAGSSAPITRPPLDQQAETVPVLIGVEIGRLTPVFGTAQPPHGLSGLVRRAAYRIPEHKAAHWLLLMLGDRVDVWESRIARHPVLAAGALAAVVGGGLQLGRARRRTNLRRLLERISNNINRRSIR